MKEHRVQTVTFFPHKILNYCNSRFTQYLCTFPCHLWIRIPGTNHHFFDLLFYDRFRTRRCLAPFFASWIARSMYSWSVISLPSFLVIQKPLQDTYRGNDLLHVTDKWSLNQKNSEMDHHLRAQTLHSSIKITVPSSSFIQTILSAPESHRIMLLFTLISSANFVILYV